LIDAKLLENYAWEECGWTEKLRIVDIRVDEYLEFRDAVDTIHKILKKVYDQIEENE
jgi:hypothetical protein